MRFLAGDGLGFSTGPLEDSDELDAKVYRAAMEAARRKFSPEFMNRIDKTVVFRPLQRGHLEAILDIELSRVQERISSSPGSPQFVFRCTLSARDFLLEEGTDAKYGARHLKRAIERHVVFPVSNLIATRQLEGGDLLIIDSGPGNGRLIFSKGQAETACSAAAAGLGSSSAAAGHLTSNPPQLIFSDKADSPKAGTNRPTGAIVL